MSLVMTIIGIAVFVAFVAVVAIAAVDDWREHRGYSIAGGLFLLALVIAVGYGVVTGG